MNAASSKTRKKTSPKTPAKGQQTLSSFLINGSKRSSSSTQNSGRLNDSSQLSEDRTVSTSSQEAGKKRKLSQKNGDTVFDQPKPKKMSVANVDTKNASNSVKFGNGMKHDQSEDRELSNKLNAGYSLVSDDILPSKSTGFIDRERGDSRNKLPGDSIHSNCVDLDLLEGIKSKSGIALKENSFGDKISKKLSSPDSSKIKRNSVSPRAGRTKKYSPLKMDSQNVQSCLLKGEEDILAELLMSDDEKDNKIVETGKRRDTSDLQRGFGKKSNDIRSVKEGREFLSSCKNGRSIANGKEMEIDIARSEKDAYRIKEEENSLVDAFDKSFKAEDEVDKTSGESGCNSQSYCTTLTDDFDDVFSDDWNGDAQVEVDLTKLQRCKVLNTSRDKFHNLIVDVIHVESQIPVTVTFMGFWREARLQLDDFVNIQATKQSNAWIVDNNNGFVVEHPDFLVSGTSVVGALFCARRGVLSDRFKGIESVTDCKQGSSVMVIGSLVHELLQEVLKKQIYTKPGIAKLMKDMLNSQNTANMLYSASMSMETCQKEMSPFVPKIFHFIERYVKDKTSHPTDENFNGKINEIRDIEENLWVPQLGIKGKVDVTVEVNVNLRSRIMPLELKTGRASFSLEHRGQVILYTMMMAITGQDADAGLLLYLRENIMREIKVGHPERRDLILLRNNLAYYLTRTPEIPNRTDSGLESESRIEKMELPEPINHRACQNCPYSALCCTYLKDENYKLSDRHPLTPILKELDNYLKPEHIEYVKKWVKMLQIDEIDQVQAAQPLRFIWTVPPTQREKKGKCISNLKITGKVTEESSRYRHTFARVDSNDCEVIDDLTKSGFTMMEYIIISTDTKFNVCAGPVIELSKDSITVLLERNLKEKKPNEIFHIDPYTSQSVLIINLSNIGYLLDNNAVTERMRKIVIERQPATFLTKLNRSVTVAATPILKPLNKTQQRAVLKVLTANEYFLIKGMPGSGKTRTLVAIIQLLVKMGKSVLLTAHTHSAVDNVLLKLIKTGVDFLRLGSASKIHPLLASKSESVLTQECYSPESLDTAYNSKNVVCVTCLGANHPLLGRRMFDVCLVDESTQVLQSAILRPLYSASKFVLIGDPDQLPPVVRSNAARELGMDQSLFARLDSENNTIILTSQYRMNERIMSIANQVTYKGQLIIGADEIGSATLDIPNKSVLNSSQEWVRAALSTDIDDSVVVLDTRDKYNNLKDDTDTENEDYHAVRKCSNLCEAAVILHLVTTLIQAGVVAEKIGVIAPYREQVNLLRDIVKQDVEVNTVDQYQGRDKEIILYSGTKSACFRSDAGKEFNILDDHRRLTVAITRAKHKLIIVGDVGSLKQYVPFKKLFTLLRSKDFIVLENESADFMWKELLSVVKR